MFSTPLPIPPSSTPPGQTRRMSPRPGPGATWLWRVLYILYCLEIGIFLIFLPWLNIWEQNYLLYQHPTLQGLAANPYLKGAVLGLGIVNLLIGIQEIAQLRKNTRRSFSR
jgi:hypothetical protein